MYVRPAMRVSKSLLVFALLACSRKKEPPVVATPPSESAKPTASSAPKIVEAPRDAEPAKPDDAIEAELTLAEEFELNEGKVLPIPKFVLASTEAAKKHSKAFQAEYDSVTGADCRDLNNRITVSFVPASYFVCRKEGRSSVGRLDHGEPTEITLHGVEGDGHLYTRVVESIGVGMDPSSGDFVVWNTPRGYFVDVTNDGRLTFILRRQRDFESKTRKPFIECIGRAWDSAAGTVSDVKLPTYPTRGRDIDDDGKNEFPTVAFSAPIVGWQHVDVPAADTLCNVPFVGQLGVDVMGVDQGDPGFYIKRMAGARARATRVAARAGKTRKKGKLRMTDTCAIDFATVAAEVYVYARILGDSAEQALAEADLVMAGRSIKLADCEGVTRLPKQSWEKVADSQHDHWPDVRAALAKWKPTVVYPQPAPANDGG